MARAAELLPKAPLRLDTPPEGFFDDPYPYYRALCDLGPIVDDGAAGFLLFHHAHLSRVYRDAALFTSDKRDAFLPRFGRSPLYEHHTTSLVFNDEPAHGRVRRRLVGALTPRAITALAPGLRAYCDTLIDRLLADGGGDLVTEFAAAVPVRVIGDLLSVPDNDRGALREWSLAILGALEPAPGQSGIDRGNAAVSEFSAYVADLIKDRSARPRDPETDLLTRLIAGDPPLAAPELIHNAIFLLNAGHETTTNLIGSALHLLADNPSSWPRGTDASGFVEEVLRYESPNQLGNRRLARDTTIAGVCLPEGAPLTLIIGAANRDPAVFDDPDRFDAQRSQNRHLAFGAGSHQCAGLSLARLEARIALDAWRSRIAAVRFTQVPRRQRRVRFRGFEALPATVIARARGHAG